MAWKLRRVQLCAAMFAAASTHGYVRARLFCRAFGLVQTQLLALALLCVKMFLPVRLSWAFPGDRFAAD